MQVALAVFHDEVARELLGVEALAFLLLDAVADRLGRHEARLGDLDAVDHGRLEATRTLRCHAA